MNAFRLSTTTTSRRLLAETCRSNGARVATAQHRSLHADAPFLFSLPSDPEAAMARTNNASPSQSTVPASSGTQQQPTTSTSPQRHPDAPYILSIPAEFDVHNPNNAANGGASGAGGSQQMRV